MTDPASLGKPLLDYAVITEPFPLYAATEGAPPTTLHIVVSNGGAESVYCREIFFSLPHGDLAQSLVDGDKDGQGSATGWTVEQVDPGTPGLDIALPEGDYEHFRATHQDEKAKVDRSGITITLKNLRISKEPGTARVEIRETATKDLGNWPTSVGYTTCALTKFPAPEIPVQIVNDFRAEKPEAASGSDVHLTWRGPRTLDYTVSYGSGAKAADKQDDTIRDLEWKGTITRDTTFYLTYDINKATHCLTTTVTVPDPHLTGLSVDGDVTVTTGTTTVGALTAKGAVTVQKDLTVEKDGTLTTKGALAAKGLLTASGDLAVTYGDQLKMTTVGVDGLQVQGGLLSTKGDLTVGGTFEAAGDVSVFNGSAFRKHSDYISDGLELNYSAPTDGFIGVMMESLTVETSADAQELTAQWGLSVDVSSGASYWGGIPQGHRKGYANAQDSVLAPVRKGDSIKIAVHGPQCIKGSGYINVFWIPLGKSQDLR